MAQLDTSIPMSGKVANIGGSFMSNFQASQKFRASQKLADLTLSTAEKKIKRDETYREILGQSLNEKGAVDSKKAYGLLNQAGLFPEAEQVKTNFFKSQAERQKRFEAKKKALTELEVEKGKMFGAVLDSDNPVESFAIAKEEWIKNGIKLSPGLLNYDPTTEELQDGGIDPRVKKELEYHRDKMLTPTERIARAKLANEGLSPEEIALKKEKMAVDKLGLRVKELGIGATKLGHEIKLKKLNAELKDMGKSGLDPEVAFKREEKLRSEFIKQNKSFQDVGDAYNRVQAVGAAETAAGDMALIFNYMKMLDPGSVVRESEFRTAEQAKAWLLDLKANENDKYKNVPAFVKTAVQKATTGTFLLPSQRKDFMARSADLMDVARKGYFRSGSSYKKLAEEYGLNPDRVIIDLGKDVQLNNKIGKYEVVK